VYGVCGLCGSKLIYDGLTHSWVCPVCGVVYGYEAIASRTHLSHVAPLDGVASGRASSEVVRRARLLFGSAVASELRKLDRAFASEVLEALEALVEKREYRVPWRALRKAVEVASKCGLSVDLTAIRERRVRGEIERFVRENRLPVDPGEVWSLALKHRSLWAGRRAATIAKVFTYIYCARRGIKVKLDPKTLKLARILEKVVDTCG